MGFHKKHSGQSINHNTMQEPLDPDTILARSLDFLPENYQSSEQFNKSMNKLLRKSQRILEKNKQPSPRFTRRYIPRMAIAATIIFCSFVVVQAHNDLLFEFWSQKNETHTAVKIIQQNLWPFPSSQFRDTPEVVYFPSYLPDGYSITDIRIDKDKITFFLEKEENRIWIIQESLSNFSADSHWNFEGKNVEKIIIRQMNAMYYIKDGACCLSFSDSQNNYLIKGTALSKKEIIQIAESFKIVF